MFLYKSNSKGPFYQIKTKEIKSNFEAEKNVPETFVFRAMYVVFPVALYPTHYSIPNNTPNILFNTQ